MGRQPGEAARTETAATLGPALPQRFVAILHDAPATPSCDSATVELLKGPPHLDWKGPG